MCIQLKKFRQFSYIGLLVRFTAQSDCAVVCKFWACRLIDSYEHKSNWNAINKKPKKGLKPSENRSEKNIAIYSIHLPKMHVFVCREWFLFELKATLFGKLTITIAKLIFFRFYISFFKFFPSHISFASFFPSVLYALTQF